MLVTNIHEKMGNCDVHDIRNVDYWIKFNTGLFVRVLNNEIKHKIFIVSVF